MLIFEQSRSGRRAVAQTPRQAAEVELPERFWRRQRPLLPGQLHQV